MELIPRMSRLKTYDLLVVGAGVLGLWVAREAARRGLDVAIIDAAPGPGMGASGTPLAVLLPHLPDRSEPKRLFQRDALVSLPAEIAALEAETGRSAGYVQRGRVMPVRKPTFLEKAKQACAGADRYWDVPSQPQCELLAADQATPSLDGWLARDTHPLGVLHDTLSAAVRADTYIAILSQAVTARTTVNWGRRLASYDPASRTGVDGEGERLPLAAKTVITSGFGSFEILTGFLGKPTGDGVKGHAATFKLRAPLKEHASRPVLYDNGIYVVPLDAETVSVGSTTEYDWEDDQPSPSAAASMIERARALCPPLQDAGLTDLWAGIRPRAATRNPLVGGVPGYSNLYVATGGYKITFGIAHRLATCLIDEIIDGKQSDCLPDAFHASALASA